MEKVKESKKINLVLTITAFMMCAWSMKAQLPNPYPISNTSNCDVTIAYEVADSACDICENSGLGGILIPANSTVGVGSNCGSIQDVHIVIVAVDGVTVYMKSVGDPVPCIGSNGTSDNTTVSGAGCTSINIAYSVSGTTIW